MKIDPTKSAVQNLLALIDASNPSAPTAPADVTVSNLQTGSFANGGDTQVTLSGAGLHDGIDYVGSVNVTYKRLALTAEAASPTGAVSIAAGQTSDAILAEVANYYGFIPSEISWASPPAYPSGGGAGTATVQAANSLVYEDGTATVNLNWAARNTQVLIHFDGTNGDTASSDSVTNSAVTLSNGATLSSTQKKFGATSLSINGSNAVATMPSVPGAMLSGNFTIEWFSYLTADSSVMWVYGKNITTYHLGAPAIAFTSSGQISVADDQSPNLNGGASSAATSNTGVLKTGQWQHIAFVQNNGVLTIYVDGVAQGTGSTSGHTFGNNSNPLYIGNYVSGGYPLTGYLDEFRLSSVARYTGNFTPPTSPFVLD